MDKNTYTYPNTWVLEGQLKQKVKWRFNFVLKKKTQFLFKFCVKATLFVYVKSF